LQSANRDGGLMRRLPTTTKALRGTLRPDRVNHREPKPPLGIPRARRQLSKAARREYRLLVAVLAPMRVLTIADGQALELTACALAEYHQAAAVIAEHGVSYEAKTAAGAIMRRARPEQAIAADAWRRAHAGLASFGLTPAARPKVEGEDRWPRLGASALPPGPHATSNEARSEDAFTRFQQRRNERRERDAGMARGGE
jgi:P27 family predicted phage terminase small subunit